MLYCARNTNRNINFGGNNLVGMQNSGVVIAVNPDKQAPIFEYADYGFVMSAEDIEL